MLDVISAKAGRLLSVTETDIEQRKAIAGLGDDDIPRITSLKSMIEQWAGHGAEVLFNTSRLPPPNSLLGAVGDCGGASRHDQIFHHGR